LANGKQALAREISQRRRLEARYEGVERTNAVIEFTLDGTILNANDNFLAAVGYSMEEIRGKHHRMFVDPAYAEGAEYRAFWEKLGRGEFHTGEYCRYGKGGREIWIRAAYCPILDDEGRPAGVIKFAADITADKRHKADFESQLELLHRAQAIIEFQPDGTILTANDNFLATVGYSLDEIRGRHHRIFADREYAASSEYREFWASLGRGEFHAGKYQRFGKGGREIWIQAVYGPVRDANGRLVKVVKFASDVTQQVLVERALSTTVSRIESVIEATRSGDLNVRVDTEGLEGSFRELSDGVNGLVQSFEEIVGQIGSSATQISASASEIATGNHDLSGRTESQASSLEETASSMEELTSTVKQNAENARQANQLVVGTADVAVRGGAVVQQVVNTMGEISESSKKIADIISVIDGIAFQTNILALNAAVEAARAGEQGRGFAVVATEVRNLAQRSAAAAKEIKELISDSVGKVESGSKLVDEAGRTMDEIVSSVKRVTDIMAEIAAASIEQSSGIEQVNQAITQMDEVTQQNAALVEEAAAAAESLEEQAQMLSQAVSVFKVMGSAGSGGGQRDQEWDGSAERRGPDRAKNVARLPKAAPAKTVAKSAAKPAAKASRVVGGADAEGEWEDF
jgi:methyl-accepting chemotaxis protein